MLHKNVQPSDNHVIYTWAYANASARTSATSFVSTDVGKIAWQQDNNTLWLLVATTPSWVSVGGGSGSGRTTLNADTTYYVSTTGNNSNDGLSAGTAWASLQFATDFVANKIDAAGYQVMIQVADGTYSLASTLSLPRQSCTLPPIIQGNTTTPSNVVLTNAGIVVGNASGNVQWHIKAIKISGGTCISAGVGSIILLTNMILDGTGTSGMAIQATGGAEVFVYGGLTFSGTFLYGLYAQYGSIRIVNQTVTFSSFDVSFGPGFATSIDAGFIGTWGLTFSGSFTGPRYYARSNAVINATNGSANVNYFPGSTAGSTLSGGQYI